jgi:eukaryotic-like serine/threonine-protein kinase
MARLAITPIVMVIIGRLPLMPLEPGTRFGPYEVVSMLGAGGMGEVYRARDTRLDRIVAVKILAAAIGSDSAFRARFDREARTISALNHPNICVLHDVGLEGDRPYVVLEHLEGETVADALAAHPRGLKLSDVIGIAIAVADALDAAHRRGIVHRDLKPGNIMLTVAGPKLLDFGLAKQSAGSSAALSMLATQPGTATAQGTIVGTLQYMAPEQIQGQQVDPRTDLFAFGTVLYEMASGRRAFEAESQASVIAKILETDPPALSTVVPVSPPALDHFVQRCLAKNPDDRWQSARDAVLELRWIGENLHTSQQSSRPISTWRRWLPWGVAGIAVLGAIAVWSLGGPASDVRPPSARFDVPLPPKMLPLAEWQGPPSVSPDGRHVIVSAFLDGRLQLLLRRLDDTSFLPLSGTDDARVPIWSPDSRSIAFFSGGKLRRVLVSGGPVSTIADVGGLSPEKRSYSGTWSRSGVILFDMGGNIYQVADSGGTPSAVTSLDSRRGDAQHRFPQFLSDDRSFIFSVFGQNPGVYVSSLESRTAKLVVSEASESVPAADGSLVFVRDQNLLGVEFDPQRQETRGTPSVIAKQVLGGISASPNGTLVFLPTATLLTQLQWFARDGRRLGAVGSSGPNQQLALSPTGRRVALQRREHSSSGPGAVIGAAHIWILELTTGVLSRLTTGQGSEGDPAWSPDERTLAFTARHVGQPSLFKKDLSTGVEEPLLNVLDAFNLDEWTPDGQFVIFRSGGRAIYALPMSSDRKPRVVADARPVIDDQSHVSPDGRWIAFNSNESGRWEVYLASFPVFLGKRQISIDGGVQPMWRRDGRELFYLDSGGQMWVIDMTKDPAPKPRVLFQTRLNPSPYYSEYAVTLDGQRFLALEPVGPPPPLFTVIVNWRPESN